MEMDNSNKELPIWTLLLTGSGEMNQLLEP
ncbi:hypothetical protein Bhyg_09530 [Pseudolycoriella hygida]|uniref:Uncharacterized protein n=1 Tax=Pseudolycoriella hygida TaxID=35572 RepID=A0A9Q0N7R3_9DIPT|nr:hypothetical protein Bhyg_09530 [Pseudolycoriella hygida]